MKSQKLRKFQTCMAFKLMPQWWDIQMPGRWPSRALPHVCDAWPTEV